MLDPRSRQAFEAAATHLNFTRAARAAAMTQSGVSQHIARMEKELGVPLFQRVNKKVFLTGAGKILLAHLEREKENDQALLDAISGEVGQISGVVRYAMQQSCLLTPHLAQMLDQRAQYPALKLEVTLCPNEEIFQLVLDQDVDFGFVTKRINNPALRFEAFCQEEYVLVSNRKESFKNLPFTEFVSYPGMDTLYRLWAAHALPRAGRICPTALSYSGKINNLAGAITMVEKGLGATVLPRHCVAPLLNSGALLAYQPPGRPPLVNQIYMVSLRDRPETARVKTLRDMFFSLVR